MSDATELASPAGLTPGSARPGRWLLLAAAVVSAAGCDEPDPIRHYTVARHKPARRAPMPDMQKPVRPQNSGGATGERRRLLGAIVPHEGKTWFFKILGGSEAVKQQIKPFEQFIKSLGFSADRPEWSLPEGWRESAESGAAGRFATISVAPGVQMTVTALVTPPTDFEEYLLRNVNRWRDQLRLPPLVADDLSRHAVPFKVGSQQVWVVMMDSPGAGDDAPQGSPAAAAPPLPFTLTVPAEWRPAELNAFRKAAWEVSDGAMRATITISTAGGDLAGNINRWRGQVGLDPLPRSEVAGSLRSIPFGMGTAQLAELVPPPGARSPQAIVGAIAHVDGAQWFFKLQGDRDLVAAEKQRFLAFLESVRPRERPQEQ